MTDTMSRADAQTRPDKPGVQNDPVIEQLKKQFAAVTRDEAVQAVIDATGYPREKVEEFYEFLLKAVQAAGDAPEAIFQTELCFQHVVTFHTIMDTVMPDDVAAIRGSDTAHDLLERSMPGGETGAIQLLHTKNTSDGCVIEVTIRRPSS